MKKTSGILIVIASIGMNAPPILVADTPDGISTNPSAVPPSPGDTHPDNGPPEDLRNAQAAVEASVPSFDPTVRQYEDKVLLLERRGGAYDPDLPETLVGLGLALMSKHEYDSAEHALWRALHTTRVNHGLYSVEQLPIVERLIELNTQTRDYGDLSQNYHFLFWLSKRIYGGDDPRLLPDIDRMGRWHLAAYATEADDTPMSHLFAAEDLYSRAISIIEKNFGPDDPRLVNALYGVVVTKYQMAAQVSQIEFETDILAADADTLDARSRRVYRDAGYRERLMIDSFVDGKEAMDRIALIHEENDLLPPESHAMALVHLGDWNLLFNKWNSAQDAYSEAYGLLSEEGRSHEEIDRLFAQPRSLPAIGLPEAQLRAFLAGGEDASEKPATQGTEAAPAPGSDWNPRETLAFADAEEIEPVTYVLLAFDVSRTGKARNIRVVESSSDDKSLWRKARKSMAVRKFRPRIRDGEVVDASDVKLRMVFRD